MENKFSKIITFGICMFIASCAFDGEEIKELAKITEHYYVIKNPSADYGLEIGYSSNNAGGFEVISSYCKDIYYSEDTIMYSNSAFSGSHTISYYIISLNPKREDGLTNDPIQIKEATFKNNVVRFNKVNLPDKTSL